MARRKKNKVRQSEKTTLDLHGEKHADIDRIVENHIFLTPCPHDIITGNSAEMHKLTRAVLDRHGFQYKVGDYNNKGYIKVIGF